MVSPKRVFLILYLLFIVYGSLFPLAGWRPAHQDLWSVWMQGWSGRVSRSDLLTNFLVYIPFGFLLAMNLPAKAGPVARVVLSALTGAMLSVSMEYLQMFLPGRTSSLNDVLLNTLSSCFGGLCAWGQGQQSPFGTRLRTLRQKCFHAGRLTDIGLIILGAWALVQLAPFVPSLDFGDIKNGLKPIWQTMQDLSRFDVYKAATYSLYIAALAAALRLVLRYSRSMYSWYFIFVGSVLLCKVGIVGRQLSLEAIAGFCVGTCALLVVQLLPKSRIPLLALAFVVGGFAVDELRPVTSLPADFHGFSWIPFNSQIDNNMKGIGSIIEGLWPFAAMAYFFIAAGVVKRPIVAVFWGGVLACSVLLLEAAQTQIPGRYPDITLVLLAVVGWSLPWLFPAWGVSGETGTE